MSKQIGYFSPTSVHIEEVKLIILAATWNEQQHRQQRHQSLHHVETHCQRVHTQWMYIARERQFYITSLHMLLYTIMWPKKILIQFKSKKKENHVEVAQPLFTVKIWVAKQHHNKYGMYLCLYLHQPEFMQNVLKTSSNETARCADCEVQNVLLVLFRTNNACMKCILPVGDPTLPLFTLPSRHWRHSCDKMDQAFPILFCIL